jgi:hypothetical protein
MHDEDAIRTLALPYNLMIGLHVRDTRLLVSRNK